jgi:hypothetical protein
MLGVGRLCCKATSESRERERERERERVEGGVGWIFKASEGGCGSREDASIGDSWRSSQVESPCRLGNSYKSCKVATVVWPLGAGGGDGLSHH